MMMLNVIMLTPLAWAINAKKLLINDNGFSPSQLVFGQNCNLPIPLMILYRR